MAEYRLGYSILPSALLCLPSIFGSGRVLQYVGYFVAQYSMLSPSLLGMARAKSYLFKFVGDRPVCEAGLSPNKKCIFNLP